MVTDDIRNYKFNCTDSFGEDGGEDIFTERVIPIMEKYNMSEHDAHELTTAIAVMMSKAYDNGQDVECASHEW